MKKKNNKIWYSIEQNVVEQGPYMSNPWTLNLASSLYKTNSDEQE